MENSNVKITIHNFAIKNVKIYSDMSEETISYSADLVYEGRKVGNVYNSGKGGSDNIIIESKKLLPYRNQISNMYNSKENGHGTLFGTVAEYINHLGKNDKGLGMDDRLNVVDLKTYDVSVFDNSKHTPRYLSSNPSGKHVVESYRNKGYYFINTQITKY